MKSELLLLLHMHQPDYRNPLTGRFELPWVRLHAVREYNDVAAVLEAHPGVRLTVNFVGSLIAQIDAYAGGRGTDTLQDLSLRDPGTWRREDKHFALRAFFMANLQRMIDPVPRWAELLNKRGRGEFDADDAAARFTPADWRDLSVHFNLGWVGFAAAREYPVVGALRAKGRDYTADDARAVMDVHHAVTARVLDRWRALADTGRIELSTTPLYHPILPLLVDSRIARRSDPTTPLPDEPFAHPDDAAEQLHRGAAVFAARFGRAARGLWPSEGSVAPEIIAPACAAGFAWTATDETIVCGSVPGAVREALIYRPWWAVSGTERIAVVFRDKALSDRIGFAYKHAPATDAANDFMERLRAIDAARPGARIVVALDGENPWEHYDGGGEPFLNTLFARLADDARIETRTIGESLAARPPAPGADDIVNLRSASWIDDNFRVWIGGPEENRAWSCLARARAALDRAAARGNTGAARAYDALLAAEGSDWFWWYGDRFQTETRDIFDRLFRSHLIAAYRALGEEPPAELFDPIAGTARGPVAYPPIAPAPRAPEPGDPFAWRGAGFIPLVEAGSAMFEGGTPFAAVRWVHVDGRTWLRLEPGHDAASAAGRTIEVRIAGPAGEVSVIVDADATRRADGTWVTALPPGPLPLRFALRLSESQARGDGRVELYRRPRTGYYEAAAPDADLWTAL